MTNLEIFGKSMVSGEMVVPGDKSISHRSAIFGAIAKGRTTVDGFLTGEDALNTLKCFRDMGVEWRWEGERLIIDGRGREGIKEPTDIVDLGNSGTSIRLITGLVSGFDQYTVLTGDKSLRSRPMGRVANPLRQMGAKIDGRKNGTLAPLSITGGRLKGITYEMPVASAQIKSALLLAGLWADGDTSLREPGPARDHTEIMLKAFGVDVVKKDSGWITLKGGSGDDLKGRHIEVPGDISSAAFFIVAALITPGSKLTIKNVGVNPTRTGILDVLKTMGAKIELTNKRLGGAEPVADIVVAHSALEGVEVAGETVVRAIDEFPILAVAAAYAKGKTVITGAEELRVKESDRIATMSGELRKMGADIEELSDGMIVKGGKSLKSAELESHGDHRIAMAGAVAALAAEGKTVIRDTECVATSFPGFENLLFGAIRR